MSDATIHSTEVVLTPSSDAVEVTARLLSGIVKEGMFLYIRLNSSLDITVPIEQVTSTGDGELQLLLNCEKDVEHADFVLMLNFADETLRVSEDGIKTE